MYLLYRFLKVTLFPIWRFYLRRVYFSNAHHLPPSKPILLAGNHPNSFLDGVAVSYFLWRKTFVLVRGDVFKKKWANALLRSMCLMPIFRESDGEGLRKNKEQNDKTFDDCYQLFGKNQVLLIFPEAIARPEKRLRPVRKGTARMAFDMVVRSGWTMDLQVVPTSLNYTHFNGFRKELMIDFGEAISVLSFKDLYAENSAKAINQLTALLEGRMRENMIISEMPENDDLFEQYTLLQRNNIKKPFFGFWFNTKSALNAELLASKQFNRIMEGPSKVQFQSNLQHYFNVLGQFSLNDMAIRGISGLIWKLLFLVSSFFPALLGGLLTWTPFALASFLSNKWVKRREFYDSVLLGLSLVFDLLYSILLFTILYVLFAENAWWLLLMIKIFGVLYFFMFEALTQCIQFFKSRLFRNSNPEIWVELNQLRREIIAHR